MGHISFSSRGKWSKPVLIKGSGLTFVDENDNDTKSPLKCACDHPDHWKWGKGTRNGQKLYYPTSEMYIQKWELTESEMNEAVEAWDMFSLDMQPRIICENCKLKIYENSHR